MGRYASEEDRYYSAAGERLATTLLLVDGAGREWMGVQVDRERKPTQVVKHHWEGGEMRWHFEYDARGTMFGCYDTEDVGGSRFSEVRHNFADAAFYEHGFALPREIAGTPIPF